MRSMILKGRSIITGFTLAEVLITLVIVGVIASLTIPALITSIQDAQYHTAWKKEYSDVNQANNRILADNGGSLAGVFANSIDMRDHFLTYLSYTKKCDNGAPNFGNCWHDENNFTARYLNGNYITVANWGWGSGAGISGAILNNGSMLAFGWGDQQCNNTFFGLPVCGEMYVDVNGYKNPNMVGKDIYCLFVTKDSIKPCGGQGDTYYPGWPSSGYQYSAQYLYQ